MDEIDVQYEPPKPPGLLERWLRRIFVDDLRLKLVAIGITLVLWFAVTGQKRPASKRLPGVQLSYVHSESLAISNDPPTRVDITVSGSKDEIDQLNPANLLATLVLGDNGTGNRVLRLTRDDVTIDQLPPSVRIDSFQPGTVLVRLEPKIERQVDVTPKLEGKIADGFEVRNASAVPAKVRLRGPASILNELKNVSTESVVIDGRTTSFDLNSVAVDVPSDKVEVLDSDVQVHVEIAPKPVDKTYRNVPVGERPQVAALNPSLRQAQIILPLSK